MQHLRKLEEQLVNAEYVSCGKHGHSIHYAANEVYSSSVLQGYGLSDDEIEFVVAKGIPLIDKQHVPDDILAAFAVCAPTIKVSDYETPPWGSLNYAPLEVVASFWKRAGARIENIDTVKLAPGMFRPLKPYEETVLDGISRPSEEKIFEGLIGFLKDTPNAGEPPKLPPGIDKESKTAKVFDILGQGILIQAANTATVTEERKGLSFQEIRDKYPNYEDQIPSAALNKLTKMMAPVAYIALLQSSGQLNQESALKRISESVSGCYEREKAKFKGKSRAQYSHHIEALKIMAKMTKSIQTVCDPSPKKRQASPSPS